MTGPIAIRIWLAALLAAFSSACAEAPLTLPPVSLPSVALPSLPLPATTSSLGADRLTATPSPDSPVEVYSRIARGALKCWFGAEGTLRKTHVFHARVDPPPAATPAEIVVLTRDDATPAHGSLRAFQITISPAPAGALIEAQNLKFPEPQGAAMTGDVSRWISGKEGCSVMGTGGWTAAPATDAPPAAPAGKKKKVAAKRPPSK